MRMGKYIYKYIYKKTLIPNLIPKIFPNFDFVRNYKNLIKNLQPLYL